MPLSLTSLKDWTEVRGVLRGHGHDFWASCNVRTTPMEMANKLPSMRVEGELFAEEAFTHAYIAPSKDVRADLNALIDEFGLGLRRKRACSQAEPGCVLVLVSEGGPSGLKRRRTGLAPDDRALSTEERVRRTRMKFEVVSADKFGPLMESNKADFWLTSFSVKPKEMVCRYCTTLDLWFAMLHRLDTHYVLLGGHAMRLLVSTLILRMLYVVWERMVLDATLPSALGLWPSFSSLLCSSISTCGNWGGAHCKCSCVARSGPWHLEVWRWHSLATVCAHGALVAEAVYEAAGGGHLAGQPYADPLPYCSGGLPGGEPAASCAYDCYPGRLDSIWGGPDPGCVKHYTGTRASFILHGALTPMHTSVGETHQRNKRITRSELNGVAEWPAAVPQRPAACTDEGIMAPMPCGAQWFLP